MKTTAPQELTGKQFQTRPDLRRIQIFRLGITLMAICAGTYILLRVLFNRPLYPISFVTLALFIGFPIFLCWFRVAWGTSLVFSDSEISLLRGQTVVSRISRQSIQKVEYKKDSFSFRYRVNGISKDKMIVREGFSTEVWQELRNYISQYVAA